MKRTVPAAQAKEKATTKNPFQLRQSAETGREKAPLLHVYGKGSVCATDNRGHATPEGRGPLEIVVDASNGFIPLWEKNTTLRWRFQDRSMATFRNPKAAKAEVRTLLGKALLAWGDAAPVRFAERQDRWDFEIVVRNSDDCDINGCVLASAFFPDGGRHELTIYPKMFSQSKKEQVDTLIHEIGHVFGLRHFFAEVSETAWPSEVFGAHRPFSIMNYGANSELTEDDRNDLRRLYFAAWSGELAQLNGTQVRFVKPFSATASAFGSQPSMFGSVQRPVLDLPYREAAARVSGLLRLTR